MDSFIYSINATVPVFLVMVLGGVIKKIGIIDEHFANVANRYVFKVALPVLLFRDLSKSDFKSQFEPKFVLYCSIVTILMFSLVWIFTELLMKDDTQKGAFIQGSCRSSAAILGMAFVQNMYSDTGMAPLMIVAVCAMLSIVLLIITGYFILSIDDMKPNTIPIIIGFLTILIHAFLILSVLWLTVFLIFISSVTTSSSKKL